MIDDKIRFLIEGMDEERVERCGFETGLTGIDGVKAEYTRSD